MIKYRCPKCRREQRQMTRDIANGGVWRPLGRDYTLWPDSIGIHDELNPPFVVPANHDVRVRAIADGGTTEIYAQMEGVLASISNLS